MDQHHIKPSYWDFDKNHGTAMQDYIQQKITKIKNLNKNDSIMKIKNDFDFFQERKELLISKLVSISHEESIINEIIDKGVFTDDIKLVSQMISQYKPNKEKEYSKILNENFLSIADDVNKVKSSLIKHRVFKIRTNKDNERFKLHKKKELDNNQKFLLKPADLRLNNRSIFFFLIKIKNII